ncbi:MAG: hypothetical protein M1318_02850 [Firmicutes bacterium]|nr:hypothetical protein [Bacillota bacterium]
MARMPYCDRTRCGHFLVLLAILLWGAVIALSVLKPVDVERGFIAAYLWGWSEKAQTLLVLLGGLIAGAAVV